MIFLPQFCLSGGGRFKTSLSTKITPKFKQDAVTTFGFLYTYIPCHEAETFFVRLLLGTWKTVQRVSVCINGERTASWESKGFFFFGNMAAAVGRLLSFSKNAKGFIAPLRLTSVPFHRYGVDVSNTGEPITHTGQVRTEILFKRCFDIFSSAGEALA